MNVLADSFSHKNLGNKLVSYPSLVLFSHFMVKTKVNLHSCPKRLHLFFTCCTLLEKMTNIWVPDVLIMFTQEGLLKRLDSAWGCWHL